MDVRSLEFKIIGLRGELLSHSSSAIKSDGMRLILLRAHFIPSQDVLTDLDHST